MLSTSLLLQIPSGVANFLPMLLIIVVFYFFMIRPQMKKAKDHKKYVEELKKGDRVVTTSGMHGRIVDLNDTTFVIEVESGAKLRFDKSAVSLESSKALDKV